MAEVCRTRARHLIWVVVVWCLCLVRNKVIFKGKVACAENIVAHIKVLSWCWVMASKFKVAKPVFFGLK
jgi:hypothetical protein